MASEQDPLLSSGNDSLLRRARSNSAPPAPNQGRTQYIPPVFGAVAAGTSALSTGTSYLPSNVRVTSTVLGFASGLLWAGGAGVDEYINPHNSRDSAARTVGNVASIGAGLSSSVATVLPATASYWSSTTSSVLWGVNSGISMLRGAAATVSGFQSRDVWQSVSGAAQTLSGAANAGAAYMSYEAARHATNHDTATASSYAFGSAGAWLAGEALGALSTWAATPSRRATVPDLESGLGSSGPALRRSHSDSSLPINIESPPSSPVPARQSPRVNSARSNRSVQSDHGVSLPVNAVQPVAVPVMQAPNLPRRRARSLSLTTSQRPNSSPPPQNRARSNSLPQKK